MQTLSGPLLGAVTFTWLQDSIARSTDYWRALLGGVILLLVLAFPQGLVGFLQERFDWLQRRLSARPAGAPA